MRRARNHWIPPIPLAAGIAFQVLSWTLVALAALRGPAPLALAWIHAVAVGWLTLTALSVLVHVVPAFTDLPWRGELVARAAVMLVALAAAAFVAALALPAAAAVAVAGTILAAAVCVYVIAAFATLAQRAEDPASAAVARALGLALAALAATALLGARLSRAYAAADARVLTLAPSHALLGIGAWLTVLTTGVSIRTFRPMLGATSRFRALHVIGGTALFTGACVAAVGAPISSLVLRLGVAILGLGTAAYVADVADIVARATTPHRPPRAFVVASIAWMSFAATCAIAAAYGAPRGASLAVFAALAGWVGGMVGAHLHHLGVRVLVTLVAGDDDETRPWEVLRPALTWTSFACAQVAVGATIAALASDVRALYAIGGAAGIAGLVAMTRNLTVAASRAALRAPVSG